MKLLLDENLPHDLRHFLPGHEVFTVAYMDWASFKNGELLRAAADAGFDAMITKDSGVEYQQRIDSLPISIVVVRAKTNKLDDIRPLVAELLQALMALQPKTLIHVG